MTTTGTAQRREADLLLGRKCVWEFDPHTRGWKIVVDADLNIEDIQIGAVEIKDHTTDDRAHVDASGLLHVFDHASTGAFVLVWVTYDYPEDSPFTNEDYGAFILGVRQHGIGSPVDAEGDFQGFLFNDQGQLHTYTTGSHTIADTELPDPIMLTGSLGLTPVAPYAGALGYAWDVSALGRGWIPLQAADGGAGLAHPNGMLVTKAFMQAAEQGGSLSYNVQVVRPNTDQEIWTGFPQLLKTAAAMYAFDGSGTFARLREGDLSDIYPNPTYALEVGAFAMGYYGASGTWSRLTVDENDYLEVTLGIRLDETTDEVTAFVTGTVGIDFMPEIGIGISGTVTVDTELPAAVALSDALVNPTTPMIGAATLAYDEDNDHWERARASNLDTADTLSDISPTMAVGAVLRAEYEVAGTWYVGGVRMRATPAWQNFELLVYHSGTHVTIVSGSAVQLIDADGDMALIDGAGNLMVNLGVRLDATNDSIAIPHAIGISGSYSIDWPAGGIGISGTVTVDTELPAAVSLADAMANPTAPAVASHLLGYNGATWDRIYVGISGSLRVDLATRLDKINDEVTAYVTGTVGVDWPADGIGISGTVWVDTELPAAATLADATATPTAPAVGAFGLAYDEVDDTWDRMRQEGGSGSYALRTSEWVAGSGGYEELINKSVGAWSDRDLIVFHSGTHVTMVSGSAVNILGQTRTIERSIINITGSAGEYMLITGAAGQQVKVTEVMAIVSADTELIFESGWTGTWLSGKMSAPADGDGFFCGACATPDQNHFETESGDMLVLRLVAGAQVGGWINWYYE